MDSRTAVVLMTLNLAVTSGLIAMIARRTHGQQALLYCALSTGLFAAAFVLRLTLGMASAHPLVLVADGVMVLAAGLFLHGQRRYLLQADSPLAPWLGLAAAFVLAQLTLTQLLGQQARHIMLNGTLGLMYAGMGWLAWRGSRVLPTAERAAQRLMLAVATLLSTSTLLRTGDAAWRGVDTLFAGPTAQAHYALSSISILLMGPSVLWWMFVRLNSQLQQLAIHDSLTGALNRNGLQQAVRRHFAARTPQPLVWLLADIDHFKAVNDRHGHAVGDQLLKAVAQVLTVQVRGVDFVARLGGEEFLVAAGGLAADQAAALAERLRGEVAALRLPLADGTLLRGTVSLGVSPPFLRSEDWESHLKAADDAMYRAKGQGRDRVEFGTEPGPAGAAPAAAG
jgi:diguanylate cyclase (GGDEF)-like protein